METLILATIPSKVYNVHNTAKKGPYPMAKEEIYTIPVIDAFKEDCECPLCHLYRTLEKDSVDFVLGPSYMESDVRELTNEHGFCKLHFHRLYAESNRLGVALMMESHMKKIREDLKKKAVRSPKPSKFGFKKQTEEVGLSAYTDSLIKDCYICRRVDGFFQRYMDTLFYLYKKDDDFRKAFEGSKGFCLQHFGQLFDLAAKHLKQSQLESFTHTLLKLQEENFDRVIGDIEWFITKFDYRFEKEPWKNSKDAVIRSIEKTASIKVKD